MDSNFKKGFHYFLRRRRRRRLVESFLSSQNALGGISYSSFFFPFRAKKSPKVDTQSLFWWKFPFSKTSPQILALEGGWEGRNRPVIVWTIQYKNRHQLNQNMCGNVCHHCYTKNSKKRKKHYPMTFTISARQLISSMSLPPEKRRDFTPIP
jgi:hypothetical protein